MTLPSTFYEQSYPPSVFGPPPEAGSPTIAVAGSPGHYLPAGSVVPDTEGEFLSLGLIAQPLSVWPVAQYVATGDGTHMGWTGTSWAVNPGLTRDGEPDPPAEPEVGDK